VILSFVVPGEPVAKERPRTAKFSGKTIHYTPAKTKAYEKLVAKCAAEAAAKSNWNPGDDNRFGVVIRIFRKHEGVGGDIDNYVKSVLDGINAGGIWRDDRYVRKLDAELEKFELGDRALNCNPYVFVVVTTMR
jgi:Holliday junction resolvase RusA-like endonuclease